MEQSLRYPSRRAFLLTAGAAGLGLLAGCAPPVPGPRSATDPPPGPPAPGAARPAVDAPLSPPVTVRTGRIGLLVEAGQVIAEGRGYFREQGIAIEYHDFDSAARMIAPLGAGPLDVGSGTVSAGLFNAAARGVPIKIVASQARHAPGANALYLMARKDLIDSGEVRDYPDLRGRKIAVTARGIILDFLVAGALALGGLQLADVELVDLSFPDMIRALANRAIDLAAQTEPTATMAETRGVAVKWREAADIRPGVQAAVVLYAPEFAQQAEAARRWMVAYLKGVRDYHDAFKRNRGRAEVVALLAERTAVADPALYDRMGFSDIDPNGRVDEASLEEQLEWHRQQGLVPQPVELRQLLAPSFADHAVQRLGRHQ